MSYSILDDTCPKIIQPKSLIVELMEHQKTAIYAMKELEDRGYVDIKYKYYDNELKNLRIETNVGILGDKVGSGKTLIVTSLLLEQPVVKDRPVYFASDRYTTIKDIGKQYDILNISVIIVPKSIQHQWEDVFKNSVSIDVFKYISHVDATTRELLTEFDSILKLDCTDEAISKTTMKKNVKKESIKTSVKIMDKDNNPDKILTVLCNEHTIVDVIEKFGHAKWNRIIIDEADTVQFAALNKIKSSFVWLVTGTTNGIPYSSKKYIKDIFGKNLTWLPDFLLVKNKNEYIDMSIELPKPNRIIIKCHTPSEVRLLAEHIPKNIMNMINAGNTDDAIKSLNCHVDTTDNIFKVISRNYVMAIKNKEIELDAEKKKKYNNLDKDNEQKKRIKKLELVIGKLQSKLTSMKKTLYESANDELCPICMGEFDKPTMVDCCAHKYCFNCLTLTLNSNSGKCPVCQTKVTKNKMHIVTDAQDDSSNDNDNDSNHNDKKPKREMRDKIIELLDIVKSNKKGRFLVFADYDKTFSKIEQVLVDNKIKYGILQGSGTKVKKTLEDFQKGKINVIMLNAKNFGAGMNLQCATDIVMYHRFTEEMEEQIIGRGQRLGREGTLNVYYLIHDNEKSSFVDDNFNDMDYQDYLERLS